MSREQLVAMAKRNLEFGKRGSVDLADAIVRVPASNYFSPERWEQEMQAVFRRLPLTLAFSAELPNPGDYKAMEVLDTPVLIARGADGVVRAFVNSCSHRGAVVVAEGTGNARRFACPYHAWTYDQEGALVGVLDREAFGDFDMSCMGLAPLSASERCGIIFVTLRAEPTVDIDTFLSGYDEMLNHLALEDCRVVGSQTIAGPNWKVAYDGYLDLYHLPILHKNSFGPDMPNKAVYDVWGPHQRASSPAKFALSGTEEPNIHDWPVEKLTSGVWTIFPHVSIASFDAEGRVFMVSVLLPGSDPGSSATVQTFLHSQPDAPGQAESIAKTMAFLHHVVQDEDYFTGLRLQKALRTGAKTDVLFGRNEGGGQRFHRWVDTLLATDDIDVSALFKADLPARLPTSVGGTTAEPLVCELTNAPHDRKSMNGDRLP